ncbi:phage tail protein [Bombilactobacillus bombi]|uniref:Phage tail protein n=1 Tax=Bombilactobacillus bombi TaxID=1303590 RepID=A0A3R6YRG0_9LACO|nr:tape measure protein [Bombilactobacillus bombi]RHW49723.1 phage tail protein [Bombilactobacillus bombi]
MAIIQATVKINDAFSGTLSKLNNGLQQSASRFSNFKNAMSSGSGSFGNLNKSAGRTTGLLQNIVAGTVFGRAISKGAGLAMTGIRSMSGELNDATVAWSTFEGNMKQIGKSPTQIVAAKKAMQKYAQQTIYSASDMSSTYSQLAAVGTKNTTQLVKGFGGLAAAATNPKQAMKTLSEQATQMAAKPTIQWQDFKLMMEQTPAGMAAVAKSMGMSTKQLVKNVQDGKIKTEDFFNAIAKTGTNANFTKMATQYKTIGQAMDGLKETLANSLQPAFQKISKVGIDMISNFTDAIGNVNFSSLADKAISVFNTIKRAVGNIFNGFKSTGALNSIKSMFSDIGQAVSALFKSLSVGGDTPFQKLGSFLGGGISGAAKMIGSLAKAVSQIDPSILKAIGAAFVILKSGMRGLLFTAVIAGLNAISRMNPGQIRALANALLILGGAFATIKAAMGIANTISKITNAFGALKKIGGGKVKLPFPNPETTAASASSLMKMGAALLMVGGSVLLAGAGFALLATGITKIAQGGAPAVGILVGITIAIAGLLVIVKLLGPGLIEGAVGFIIFGAAILLIGAAILIASAGLAILATQLPIISQYGLSAAVGLLALAGSVAVFGLASIVASMGLILLAAGLLVLGVGFIMASIGAVLFGASLLIISVIAIVASVGVMLLGIGLTLVAALSIVAAVGLSMMAVGLVMIAAVGIVAAVGMLMFAMALVIAAPLMMVAAVGALLLGVAAIILGAGLLIVGSALIIVATGLTMVASAIMMLVTTFIMAGTMMVVAIVGAMNSVVNAVRNGIQNAVNTAKGFVNALVSVGRDLIQGLVNGIKSMIGSAVSAVQSVASHVVNAAKSILHIGSPSKLFNQYGRWVDQGLINGLNHDAGAAAAASSNMAQGVVNAASNMTPILNPLMLSEKKPGDILTNSFNSAFDVLQNITGALNDLNGSTALIGINGQVNNSGQITDTPFNSVSDILSTGNHSNSTNDNSSHIKIESGAINLNSTGNPDYDADKLVAVLEQKIMQLQSASLS